jgi:hypothetical protein
MTSAAESMAKAFSVKVATDFPQKMRPNIESGPDSDHA